MDARVVLDVVLDAPVEGSRPWAAVGVSIIVRTAIVRTAIVRTVVQDRRLRPPLQPRSDARGGSRPLRQEIGPHERRWRHL